VSYRLIAYKSKQHTHFTPLLSTQIDAVFGASNTSITHWFGLSITPLMLLQLLLLASHDEASLKGTQALMLVNLTISLHTGAEGIAWLHLTMLTRCSLIDSILNIICCLIRALHSRVVNLSYSYITFLIITGRSCRLFIRSLSSKIKPCKWLHFNPTV
jgi:hypothetical protein